MAFKGFNSILFDIDSLVDIEISLLKYLVKEFRESATIDQFIDIGTLTCLDDNALMFKRMYGKEDLFKSFLIKPEDKDRYKEIIHSLFERDQKFIFDNGYAFTTVITKLITAYKKAGNGVIRTTVRCDNDYQKKFIEGKYHDSTTVIVRPRKEVDMGNYARVFVGQYTSALEYEYEEPKSIVLLNYMENFDPNDFTMLRPELVISLGDVNKIEIVSAFKDEEFVNG